MPSAPVGVAPSRCASRAVSQVRTPSPGMTTVSAANGSSLTGRASSSASTSASGSSDPATVSRNATTANYPRPVTAVVGDVAGAGQSATARLATIFVGVTRTTISGGTALRRP